jgi:hypothetical protein
MSDLSELKQACLDLSKVGTDLFDLFDEHGLEGAWNPEVIPVILRLQEAHGTLIDFLSGQVTRRMLALGVSPAEIFRMSQTTPKGNQ